MKCVVSVCILTYFQEKVIYRTINSVLKQKVDFNYEIVIADDCSKDGTRDILEQFKEKYPDKIKVIYNLENLGIPQNLFNAMQCCVGKYITLLDGDDYFIDEFKLQKQVDFLESSKGEHYYGVATLLREHIKNREYYYPRKKYFNKSFTLENFLQGDNFPTNGLMFRNTFGNDIDKEHYRIMTKCSKYVDDLSFCILLLMKGDIYVMDCEGVEYCVSNDKTSHNYNSLYSKWESLKKHISLLNNFSLFFPDVDLSMRYLRLIEKPFMMALMRFRLKDFNALYFTIPKRYRRPIIVSLKAKSFYYLPAIIIRKVFRIKR